MQIRTAEDPHPQHLSDEEICLRALEDVLRRTVECGALDASRLRAVARTFLPLVYVDRHDAGTMDGKPYWRRYVYVRDEAGRARNGTTVEDLVREAPSGIAGYGKAAGGSL